MDLSKINVQKFVAVSFIIFGIIFASIGISFFVIEKLLIKNGEAATGTVIDLKFQGSTFHPLVRYKTSDGKEIEYLESSGSNPPSYEIGQTVEVYYYTDDLYRAMIKGSTTFIHIIFFSLGMILLIIGLIAFFTSQDHNRIYLKKTGTKIYAKFERVEKNILVNVNNSNPFRIVCSSKNGDSTYTYYSRDIWYDPSNKIKDKIPVYVDLNDMSKFYVDLAELNI